MILEKELKRILKGTRFFEPAKGLRNWVRSFRYLPKNLRYWIKGASDGLPIPPLRLIELVSGTRDVDWYMESGMMSARTIMELLQKNNIPLSSLRNILDFGCGSGRTLRHLTRTNGQIKFYGSDYNVQLILWCKNNLVHAEFFHNDLAPPLPFPQESVSLIYALSVFTHLSETMQMAWIDEIYRILTPHGYLILTTHGESYRADLTEQEVQSFDEGYLVVRSEGNMGSNSYGAYHPYGYVIRTLCGRFTVVDFIPEGAKGNPHQDIYLLKKRISHP